MFPKNMGTTANIYRMNSVSPRGYSYSNNIEWTKNNETFLEDSLAVVYKLRGNSNHMFLLQCNLGIDERP